RQGHRRVVLAKIRAVDDADRPALALELGGVEHVDRQLHDVGQTPARRRDERLHVLAHLTELGDQVALADDAAVPILGDLAGEKQRPAAPSLGAWESPTEFMSSRGLRN